jgi:glycosyltransferase involved in cell wall biosynthesis
MSQLREIHLINPLWNVAGGSEQRTIELFRILTPHARVNLWSDSTPDPDLSLACPIRQLDPAAGVFPRGGTLVFVGVYKHPGSWVVTAQPRRAIVIYNTRTPRMLVSFMRHLFHHGIPIVEVVYASELLQQETKLRGIVEPSFIDLSRFAPPPVTTQRDLSSFVVGRLSRDDPRKHHPDDLSTYQRLTESGCRVRIMGGMCLAANCPVTAGIELLPEKAEPAAAFLQSLECFFYRTSLQCWEAFGRVVHEAMACGLPVVCHRSGGYVTSIDHGRTGFLFDTTDEALAIIHNLRTDLSLRQSIAATARAAMETMFSPAARAKIIDYYLR